MQKAVIYARYSSDKQTEQSIEGQVRECEIFANAKGFSIIGKYFDRALTGKIDKRPDFQRLIKDSAKGLFNYVIVYQLDRFARNRYDSAHYKHQLKKNGVKVLSAKENIADDPSGILMETVLEGMAEYYSAELAQKVKRGMYEGFLKGHASGIVCYGYTAVPIGQANSSNRIAKRYELNPIESQVVRRIFDEYASGRMVKDIVSGLSAEGIRNRQGKQFHYNSVMQILRNHKYKGVLTYGEHTRENAIPRIIDNETFDKAQARTERNKINTSVSRPPERYLLSSKAYCGYCGSSNVGIVADCGTARNGEVRRYYKCYTKKKEKLPCEKAQIAKDDFEIKVVKATVDLLHKDGMTRKIAEQVIIYNDEIQANPKITQYEKQLQDVEKALSNFTRAIEQGIFNDKTQERMLQLQSEKADLIWRIDGEKLDIPIKLDLDETIFWFEQFANGETQDRAYCERLIDTFVNKVILWNDKMIIVYNIKGADNDKITVEEIIAEYENELNRQRFNSQQGGARDGT